MMADHERISRSTANACCFVLALVYLSIIFPTQLATGYFDSLTLESVFFIFGFSVVVAVILGIITFCDRVSRGDEFRREPITSYESSSLQ